MDRLEQVIYENINRHKEEPCYWWNGAWHTGADLLSLVDQCEQTLKESGFSEGQRLVVMMKNCPLISALSVAVWRLKGTFCPLNLAAGMTSISQTLELIEPFAVVLAEGVKQEIMDGLSSAGFDYVIAAPDKALSPFKGKKRSTESQDIAVIFATSGTTGMPKAVPLTHGNLLDNCIATRSVVEDLQPGDTFLNTLPNFHSFGYTIATILPLTMDARSAIVPSFLPPQQAVQAILEAPVNILFGVPAIFSYLIAAAERGSFPVEALQKMKLLISGGDRLNPNIHEQALRVVGKDVMEGYGLTETSPVVAVSRSYGTYRTGTVGPFLPGYSWQLRTQEGKPSEGNEGVLWVKGPSVTSSYFRAPELSAERFVDGWFNTGDYVRVDEDGYLQILDRVNDILIVGGFNVYPQEVEKVLSEHPAVGTIILVGVPHPVTGEVPKAFVQLKEGQTVSERELIKFAKERIAHFKVPRSVEFVEEFPLSATGKILRRTLREQAREAQRLAEETDSGE